MVGKINDAIIRDLQDEYNYATCSFGEFHSAHEGLAIIEEEFEELKEEVFKKQSERDIEKMRHEALQIAAMGLRFIVDICATR